MLRVVGFGLLLTLTYAAHEQTAQTLTNGPIEPTHAQTTGPREPTHAQTTGPIEPRQAQRAQVAEQALSPRTHDPVALLDERIKEGEVAVTADEQHGYLQALLDALDVPVSSQGLVFSRTSLQTDRISPWAPRALYFNDDVYVGWVQNSPTLEIAAIDPDEGAVFYTVSQDGGDRPIFQRQTTTCLMCHESRAVTGGIAGVIVRSVLTDRLGYVIGSLQEGSVTDRTPLEERFGGYYVTGTHGDPGHAGNTLSPLLSHEVTDIDAYLNDFDLTANGNISDLSGRFDVAPYLSGHSDLVALLVLAHQARVHNSIIRARETAREAFRDQAARLRSSGEPPPASGVLPATQHRIDAAIDRLLRDMLLVREATLNGPLQGTSGYAEEFAARGPTDSRGRSLRDLDLNQRLFRYPFSFLIYTESFDALPDIVKEGFYSRLEAVLDGSDRSADFAHLSAADRTAIGDILADTKPEFAARRGR